MKKIAATLYIAVLCSFMSTTLLAQVTAVNVAPDTSLICEGDFTTINFSGVGTCGGNYEYQVLDGGTIMQAWSTTASYNASPTTSTTFTVELRCSSTPGTVVTNTFHVIVVEEPTVTGNLTLCAGNSTTLTASGNNAPFEWWDSPNGGNQISATNTWNTPVLNADTTVYTQASGSGSSQGVILITECGLEGFTGNASADYLEISNLYTTPVNTTGWVAAVSNSYTNINSVNTILWNLPNSFNACSVVSRNDISGDPNYWGNNILWNPGNNATYRSWAIIIDDVGNVVDFACWGWTAADLAGFNPTINGFPITLGAEWTGNGVDANCTTQGGVAYSIQRIGNSDNNNMGDFVCQPSTVDVVNPGLVCGWTPVVCRWPVTITVNPNPTVATAATDALCNGTCTGQVSALGATGTSPYTYDWGGLGIGSPINNVCAGNYNLTVTDANGCTGTGSIVVNEPPPLTVGEASTDETCAGDNDGTITLTGGGGTAGYNYDIGYGAPNTTGAFTNLPPGTYNYTVTDANGCTVTGSITIVVGPSCCPMTNTVASTNPLCAGACDGTITLTENLGAPTVTYSIDGGVTTQTSGNFTNVCAGTYNILIEDGNGCQYIDVVTLTDPPALGGSITTQTDVSCNGVCDGVVTVAGSGGTTPYMYDIGGGAQASGTFNGLCAGANNVTVSDANGCTYVVNVTITEPTAVTGAVVSTTDATCGNTNGAFEIAGANGTPGYQYSMDGGATWQGSGVFSNLGAGAYSVIVEDINGCQVTVPVTIMDMSGITAQIDVQVNVSCFGGNDGSVTVSASGSVSPYQYSNDGGATFQASGTFGGLTAGNYTVIAEDANGCQFPVAVAITEPTAVVGSLDATVDVLCNGGNNGSLTVSASGGTSPYQYSSDGGTTFQASGTFGTLAQGSYTITIEDANGCQTTVNATINEPPALDLTATVTDPTCNGFTDGSLIFIPSGGTSPYQFSNDNGATWQAGTSFTGLAAGSYDLVVQDANGCSFSITEVLTDPAAVAFTTAVQDATCGNADGSITVTVTAGVSPYQYSSDNGATFQTGNALNGLLAGNYDVVVEDANGCTATMNIAVVNQAAPVIDNTAFTDPLCNAACDGTVTITASGGTSPLQYSVDNGATFQAGNAFNGLCDGTYDLVVEDANGCQVYAQVTLTDPPVMSYTAALTDLPCFQDGTGVIDITAQGGDGGPYQYSIDNGATWQVGNVFNGLMAGTYDVVVQDGNGCTVTGQETLTEPTQLTITFSAFDETCAGACDGFAIVIPGGGVTPYDYTWSSSANNTPNETNLCTGIYDLIVEDANGCIIDTLAFPISGPAAVTVDNVTVTDELCNGDCAGTITIDAPLASQFSIDNGATFQASNVFNGLCAGNYDIVVQDANGCSASDVATVNSPAVLTVNISNDTTICDGGMATMTSNGVGGTFPYTYVWDDPNATPTNTMNMGTAGTYTVTVTDANGCTAQASVTITMNPPLTVTAQTDQAICPGEAAIISATGGGGNGGPYTYDWINDDGSGWTATGGSLSVAPTTTTTYTVTVSDNCGSITTTAQVTITVNQVPTVNFAADNISGCTPVTAGFTNLTDPLLTGNCFWDFGDGNTSNDCNPTHTYYTPGCYDVTLTVTSPDGCVGDTTFTQMICVYAYPQADFIFGPQPANILNPTINFSNYSTNAVTYEWIFDQLGTSTDADPSFTFPGDQPGNYNVCLVATSASNCVDTICYNVIIDDAFLVYVPNAFTPDGDGVNDYFAPVLNGIDPLSYQFLVFDRWGELVFESYHPTLQWGGSIKGNNEMGKQDVYVWKLAVTDASTNKQHTLTGHVTLLR